MDIRVGQIWRSLPAERRGLRKYVIVEAISEERITIRFCGRDGAHRVLWPHALPKRYRLVIDPPPCPFCGERPTIRQMWVAGVFEVWCHKLPIVRGNGYQAEAMAMWRSWCEEFEPLKRRVASRRKEKNDADGPDAERGAATQPLPAARRRRLDASSASQQ